MEEKFLRYLIVFIFGLIAELIDGGIGMGYGVTSSSFLLSIGVGTAIASASIHISEIFTTLASGVSHFKTGNFDKKIFTYLVIPGVIGGAIGAYVAVEIQNTDSIKPFVSGILLFLGLLIVIKYSRKRDILDHEYKIPKIRHLVPLGLIASFIDAIGGGGWGPTTTPALIMNNVHPSKAIGSVNLAEFFVTLSISLVFLIALPNLEWGIIVPMIIGGIIGAPIAAIMTKKLPHRALGIAVGFLIIFLSIRTILKAIGIEFLF